MVFMCLDIHLIMDSPSTDGTLFRPCSHRNGSNPILERTISVHTVPFCLSTSVHTGPVCYGSVLNRSKKSSCFYQLSMRKIHVEAFKMVLKKSNCAATTKRNWSRCLHGDVSIGTEMVQFSDLIGNGLTVRLASPV